MTPRDVAEIYFNAWTQHDAPGVLRAFAEGGTYQDPASNGILKGQAIADYAAGLWAAFPDLSFEVASISESPKGLVAAQWVMTGTNSAPFMGMPPTGKAVRLTGADFIQVEGDRIRSVVGYFDSGELPRQLGLQVIVQPNEIGPFKFGTSTQVSTGKRTKPGAFSITMLHARSPEEAAQVVRYSRQIAQEMLAMPDFIGMRGVTVGSSMLTLSAWETPEGPRKLMTHGTHAAAMRDFFGPAIASGGYTSVWVPARINTMWVRCRSCAKMVDSGKAAETCACGAPLPEAIAYL
jgi:steroid delta-isomerase-like uncharacterized protein